MKEEKKKMEQKKNERKKEVRESILKFESKERRKKVYQEKD